MKGVIAWFVHNPIAANLLMVVIAVAGLLTIPGMDKEFFPQRKIDVIQIAVTYRGAGPAVVEQQICVRIEEALDAVDGIDKITSTAVAGLGQVQVEVQAGFDTLSVLNEVKSRVDSITTFPADSEKPSVSQVLWKSQVIAVGLAGDIGEKNLKELALRIKDELSALPAVQLVQIRGLREDELAIEVSEESLQRYGLTFDAVARAVSSQSLNLPGGKLRGPNGDVLLQTRSQAYNASDFAEIPLISGNDGTRIKLGDVATISDGFVEADVESRFNQLPSMSLDAFISTRPNIMAASHSVQDYVEELRPTLPEGVVVETWQDLNVGFEGRVETLVTNGLGGLLLVFILLMLFLRPLLAMWVCIGISVAFLGAFWFLPATGTSINILSMFAFILILGILVDDAIIVGESVYGLQSTGKPGVQGAIDGAHLVLKPVFFAVLTTMIVFGLFFMLPDDQPEPRHIASVVLLALVFSLIECLFILPSHLAHMKPDIPSEKPILKQLDQTRAYLSVAMQNFIRDRYRPVLINCLKWHWLTLAVFGIILLVSAGIYAGGWIQRSFAPVVPSDFLIARAEVYEGTAFAEMRKHTEQMELAASRLQSELNEGETNFAGHIEVATYGQISAVAFELTNHDNSPYSNEELVERWRDYIGELRGVKNFELVSEVVSSGKDLEFDISAPTLEELKPASEALIKKLSAYASVSNVRSTLDNPRQEIVLKLKPQAETLNLSRAELAQQVRRAFYGVEVQRIPRAREDVRVMVRYPPEQRESIESMLNMKIRTADGKEIPFETVAEIVYQPSYTKIERIDRHRSATITADVEEGVQLFQLIEQVYEQDLPPIQKKYPGLQLKLEGEQDAAQQFESAIQKLVVVTMLLVFAVMAIVFHSYWQPFLIVTAIPFGLVGAVFGHLLIGREMSMFSLMGILACAGVVVNDNLVLIDRINRYRDEGVAIWDSIVNGSTDRFRAIILTSITTFVGLLPIMSQNSVQAQFLIPMVTSLAFGVLFATFVTLIFTPALYLAGESLRNHIHNIWARGRGKEIEHGPVPD